MNPTARPASEDDIPELVRLYRLLEAEMAALEEMWVLADGLAEPVADTFGSLIGDTGSLILIGELEANPVGFLYASHTSLLPQGEDTALASIRIVFTEEPARAVGVGRTMRDLAIERFSGLGVERFDAHVLPGHRLAKNFFEAGGFSARSIIMHRDPETP